MKLAHNSLYSLGGALVPTLVSIATIPFFIPQIGADRYGALAIAWLVLGYFGAADFGIGRAITQRIASINGQPNSAKAKAIWSALFSMVGFSAIGASVLFLFANWYFSGPFDIEEGLRGEIVAAVWILALCNPLVAINGVFAGALMGAERFKLVSATNMLANSALLLFPLCTAFFISTDLTSLIMSAFLARLLGAFALFFGVWLAFLRGEKPMICRKELRKLTGFGAWIMVTALVGPLMVMADRFVIGAVQNAAAVAAYAIPFQIASRTLMLPIAVTQALFPRFSAEGGEEARQRCRDFTIFIGQFFAPIIIALICLAAPLLELWLGDSFDPRSSLVALILLAGFWTNAIANVPYSFIQARGNPRFTALLHVAELPVYALMLFYLGGKYGLPGFAAAFALRAALDCAALSYRSGALDRDSLLRLAIPAALVLIALVFAYWTDSWLNLLVGAVILAGAAVLILLLAMPIAIRKKLAEIPAVPPVISVWLARD